MNETSAGSRKPFRRLLLTGAGGNLGRQLRDALAGWADTVRVSDIVPVSAAAAHEEASVVDLADRDAVMRALMDCPVHAIIYMGEHRPSGDRTAHHEAHKSPEPEPKTEDSEAISEFVR